jgi:hypothetical protein
VVFSNSVSASSNRAMAVRNIPYSGARPGARFSSIAAGMDSAPAQSTRKTAATPKRCRPWLGRDRSQAFPRARASTHLKPVCTAIGADSNPPGPRTLAVVGQDRSPVESKQQRADGSVRRLFR